MSRSVVVLLAILPFACARSSESSVRESSALRAELLRRYGADSAVREALTVSMRANASDSAIIRRMIDIDTANTAWLAREIARTGWPARAAVGADGVSAAFLLVQHADRDTAFQIRMLPLIERALAAGEISGQEMALFSDRIATARGLLQTYGTQADLRDGRAFVKPIRDSATVDLRRARLGLPPLQAYIRILDSVYGSGVVQP